jgi:hypothetical protein
MYTGLPVPDNFSSWKSHRKADVTTASTSTSTCDDTLFASADSSDPGSAKKKSRRPGTVSAQLEQQRLQEQQQAFLQMSSQTVGSSRFTIFYVQQFFFYKELRFKVQTIP